MATLMLLTALVQEMDHEEVSVNGGTSTVFVDAEPQSVSCST